MKFAMKQCRWSEDEIAEAFPEGEPVVVDLAVKLYENLWQWEVRKHVVHVHFRVSL